MGLFDEVADFAKDNTFLGGYYSAVGKALKKIFPSAPGAPGPSASEQEIMAYWQNYLTNLAETQPQIYNQILNLIGQPTVGSKGIAEAAGLQKERLLGALRGETYDPGLERDIENLRRTTGQEIRSQLGPNYLKSTGGREKLSGLNEAELIARNKARRGEIQSGFQNLLGAGRYGLQSRGQQLRAYGQLYNPLGVSQQFGAVLEPQQAYNLLPYQSSLYQYGQGQNLLSSLFGLGGQLGAAAISA